MYDNQVGRFFNLDPAIDNYKSFSPYMYGANNPLRFIDIQGMGPGDRIKKAQSFAGTKYSQDAKLNQGAALRTGNSIAALTYLDCSELVCRVMADDGITNGVQAMSTKELANFLSDEDKFIRSENEFQAGDIFLWRDDGGGHTGIVVDYDKKSGLVETEEAEGVKYGTLRVFRDIKKYQKHNGWKGFYRPKKENPDKNTSETDKDKKQKNNKDNSNSDESTDEFINFVNQQIEQISKAQKEFDKEMADVRQHLNDLKKKDNN